MASSPPTSAALLRAALLVRGWDQSEMRRQLATRGITVSHTTITHWCDGAGIADRYRLVLCDMLGVDLGVLAMALARQAA